MSFRNLEFFLKEAFLGLSRNRLMAFVSIGTILVSLVIYGTFMLGLYNFYSLVNSFQNHLDIVAYVDEQTRDEVLPEIKARIEAYKGVKNVEFVSKDEAWVGFQQKFGIKMKLVSDAISNPLPHAYKIKAIDVHYIEPIVQHLRTIKEIEDVRYGYYTAQRLIQLMKGVQLAGLFLVLFFVIATLLIIVNTIRLTVLARQSEITIMQLVGATDSFIRWPFIIEGVVLGMLGSVVAGLILKLFYEYVVLRVADSFPFLGIVTGGPVLTFIYISVIVIGTVLGMIGGYISVTKSLKMSYK